MAGNAALRPHYFEPRRRAVVIGGKPAAAREYRLGAAWDDDTLIVTLIEPVPGVAITFEAPDFDQAFERAIAISEDMADLTGHLAEGVLVSLVERESLTDIGLDTD